MIFILQLIFLALFFELSFRVGAHIWKHVYIPLHQKDNHFYIYVVGESTSYGEPFSPKISFPKIISYMFNGKIKNKEIEVINLAKCGSNSEYAYWELFEELLLRPRPNSLLLIYSGINDYVSGYGNDDVNFRRWRLMQKSLILSRAQYLMKGIIRSGPLFNFFALDNSLPKYEYQLEKIIDLARKYNLKIIISTLVGNISEFSPQDNRIYEANIKEILDLFNSARKFEDAQDFKAAIQKYEDILKEFAVSYSHVYYHLGKCYEKLKMYGLAREYYWKAVDLGDTARPNRWRNGVIIKLAKEYSLNLVDATKIFEMNSPHGLLGYNLIIDAHHPNMEGYILLAKGFSEEIERIYGEEIAHRDFGAEDISRYFKFTSKDSAQVYLSRVGWLCFESLPIFDKEERLNRAELYLDKAEQIEQTPDIYFWHFIIAIFRNDKEKAVYYLNKGRLLEENKFVFSNYGWRWIPPKETPWILTYFDSFKKTLPNDIAFKIYNMMKVNK